jgi:hypothetical protein
VGELDFGSRQSIIGTTLTMSGGQIQLYENKKRYIVYEIGTRYNTLQSGNIQQNKRKNRSLHVERLIPSFVLTVVTGILCLATCCLATTRSLLFEQR